MARLRSMSTLVTACRQRAGKETDESITPVEWKALISEQYGELYSAVAETGLRYFETTSTITANGATSYTEPADMLSYMWVDYVDSAGRRFPLRELMAQETYALAGQTGTARFFAFVDDQIYLFPKPSSGSYEVRYVPQSPDLSAFSDATDVDVVNEAGEAFLIWGVTVKSKSKGEGDVTLAMQREAAAKERLISWAVDRALLEPRRRVIGPDDLDYANPNGSWNPAAWWPA